MCVSGRPPQFTPTPSLPESLLLWGVCLKVVKEMPSFCILCNLPNNHFFSWFLPRYHLLCQGFSTREEVLSLSPQSECRGEVRGKTRSCTTDSNWWNNACIIFWMRLLSQIFFVEKGSRCEREREKWKLHSERGACSKMVENHCYMWSQKKKKTAITFLCVYLPCIRGHKWVIDV